MKRRVCTWVTMDELEQLAHDYGFHIEPDYLDGVCYGTFGTIHYAAPMNTEETL